MQSFSTWLESAGQVLGPFAPRLAAVLAIVLVAWVIARVVRAATRRAAAAAALDTRLHSPGLGDRLAGVGAAVVWLLALPALLGTLELQGLLTPVNAMLSRLMGFLPNVLGTAIVLGIGLLMARIASQLVTALAHAAGSERLAARLGMAGALGDGGLAGLAGKGVMALMLLPILVAAVQPLGLDAITQPLSRLLDTVLSFIPRLLAAAFIIGLGILGGRILATLVTAALEAAGINRWPERLGLGQGRLAGRTASEWLGSAVMLAVLMAALTQACEILGLPVLTAAVSQIGSAMLKLATGAAILLAGVALASWTASHLLGVRGDTGSGPGAGTPPATPPGLRAVAAAWVARVAILCFAGALALHQAGLPGEIVTIAFACVAGTVAVALAVALGVGGGPVAARWLERASAALEQDQRHAGAGPASGSPTGQPTTEPRPLPPAQP